MKTTIVLSVLALFLLVAFLPRNVVADEDTDLDGLPDWWELQYSGSLNYGADDDPDLDTFTNLEEFEAGTDPMDPNDKPRPPVVDIT